MGTALGAMDLKEAAEDASGNWERMKCFIWYRATELKDADKWAVIYTSHRDSGLLAQRQSIHQRHARALPGDSQTQYQAVYAGSISGVSQLPAG